MRRAEVGKRKLFNFIGALGNVYLMYVSYEYYQMGLQEFGIQSWQYLVIIGINFGLCLFNLHYFLKRD